MRAIWRETQDPFDYHHQEVDMQAREAELLGQARRCENHELVPALPDDVVQAHGRERWRGAIALAHSQAPARN